MALIAAAIAARVAYVQFQHVKAQQREDRWWDTLKWVYDRTIVNKVDRNPLPQHVKFAILSVLSTELYETKESLRGDTVTSLLGMFQQDVPPHSKLADADEVGRPHANVSGNDRAPEWRDPTRIVVEDPAAARLLRDLTSELRGRGYGSAESYEQAVGDALARVRGGRVARFEGSDLYIADFAVIGRRRRVIVGIKYRAVQITPGELPAWALRLQRSAFFDPEDATLLVTNMVEEKRANTYLAERFASGRVRVVRWIRPRTTRVSPRRWLNWTCSPRTDLC